MWLIERDEDASQHPARVGAVERGPDVAHLHGPRKPQDLWNYVERFSANFPARPKDLGDRPPAEKDVVVITGTTGGFGCDALEHLLRDEDVQRVYAFNRKGTNALERQRKQFVARGLDGALLNSTKFRMVEAVLHEPGFGIDMKLLEEIRTSVTHIMLNGEYQLVSIPMVEFNVGRSYVDGALAWTVNFNLSITSFEPDMQGVRNFIDLALSSPFAKAPIVMLVSSIFVFNREWLFYDAVTVSLLAYMVTYEQNGTGPAQFLRSPLIIPGLPSGPGTPRASGLRNAYCKTSPSSAGYTRLWCVSGKSQEIEWDTGTCTSGSRP